MITKSKKLHDVAALTQADGSHVSNDEEICSLHGAHFRSEWECSEPDLWKLQLEFLEFSPGAKLNFPSMM